MDLTQEALAHVARLARLKLSEDELARFGADVAGILTLFGRLEDVEGNAAPPPPPPPPVAGALRADDAARADATEEILANVPRLDAGRIRVERAG